MKIALQILLVTVALILVGCNSKPLPQSKIDEYHALELAGTKPGDIIVLTNDVTCVITVTTPKRIGFRRPMDVMTQDRTIQDLAQSVFRVIHQNEGITYTHACERYVKAMVPKPD